MSRAVSTIGSHVSAHAGHGAAHAASAAGAVGGGALVATAGITLTAVTAAAVRFFTSLRVRQQYQNVNLMIFTDTAILKEANAQMCDAFTRVFSTTTRNQHQAKTVLKGSSFRGKDRNLYMVHTWIEVVNKARLAPTGHLTEDAMLVRDYFLDSIAPLIDYFVKKGVVSFEYPFYHVNPSAEATLGTTTLGMFLNGLVNTYGLLFQAANRVCATDTEKQERDIDIFELSSAIDTLMTSEDIRVILAKHETKLMGFFFGWKKGKRVKKWEASQQRYDHNESEMKESLIADATLQASHRDQEHMLELTRANKHHHVTLVASMLSRTAFKSVTEIDLDEQAFAQAGIYRQRGDDAGRTIRNASVATSVLSTSWSKSHHIAPDHIHVHKGMRTCFPSDDKQVIQQQVAAGLAIVSEMTLWLDLQGEVAGAAQKMQYQHQEVEKQFLNQVAATINDMLEIYQAKLLANDYFQAFMHGVTIGKSGASGAGDRRVALPLLSDPSYHITVQKDHAASASIHQLVGAAASGRVAPQQATRLLAGTTAVSQIANTLAGQAPVDGAAPTRLHSVTQKIGALIHWSETQDDASNPFAAQSNKQAVQKFASLLDARLCAQKATSAVRAYHATVIGSTNWVFTRVYTTLNTLIKFINDNEDKGLIKKLSGGHPAFQANRIYTQLRLDPTLCLSVSDIEDMIMLFDADLLAANRNYQLLIGDLAGQVAHEVQFERRSSKEALAHQEVRMEAYLVHTEALEAAHAEAAAIQKQLDALNAEYSKHQAQHADVVAAAKATAEQGQKVAAKVDTEADQAQQTIADVTGYLHAVHAHIAKLEAQIGDRQVLSEKMLTTLKGELTFHKEEVSKWLVKQEEAETSLQKDNVALLAQIASTEQQLVNDFVKATSGLSPEEFIEQFGSANRTPEKIQEVILAQPGFKQMQAVHQSFVEQLKVNAQQQIALCQQQKAMFELKAQRLEEKIAAFSTEDEALQVQYQGLLTESKQLKDHIAEIAPRLAALETFIAEVRYETAQLRDQVDQLQQTFQKWADYDHLPSLAFSKQARKGGDLLPAMSQYIKQGRGVKAKAVGQQFSKALSALASIKIVGGKVHADVHRATKTRAFEAILKAVAVASVNRAKGLDTRTLTKTLKHVVSQLLSHDDDVTQRAMRAFLCDQVGQLQSQIHYAGYAISPAAQKFINDPYNCSVDQVARALRGAVEMHYALSHNGQSLKIAQNAGNKFGWETYANQVIQPAAVTTVASQAHTGTVAVGVDDCTTPRRVNRPRVKSTPIVIQHPGPASSAVGGSTAVSSVAGDGSSFDGSESFTDESGHSAASSFDANDVFGNGKGTPPGVTDSRASIRALCSGAGIFGQSQAHSQDAVQVSKEELEAFHAWQQQQTGQLVSGH